MADSEGGAMPEWLTTDNVAIVVLVVGNVAQWRQWTTDLREGREREIELLRDANDRERFAIARMEETKQSSATLLRSQSATRKAMEALASKMEIEMRHLRLELRQSKESARPSSGGPAPP